VVRTNKISPPNFVHYSFLASSSTHLVFCILYFIDLFCITTYFILSVFVTLTISTVTVVRNNNKKDGYRQQNVRQRQKLISIIDYDVCMTFY